MNPAAPVTSAFMQKQAGKAQPFSAIRVASPSSAAARSSRVVTSDVPAVEDGVARNQNLGASRDDARRVCAIDAAVYFNRRRVPGSGRAALGPLLL